MAGPAAAQRHVVSVTRMTAAGTRVPGEGVTVSFRRSRQGMPGDDSAPIVIKSLDVKATADGIADFGAIEAPRPRESDRVFATWNGAEWPLRDGQTMPECVVWDLTDDRSLLAVDLKVAVIPHDEGFLIDHGFTLTASGTRALDLRGAGLRIPLLLPAVFGEPLEAGYLPDRPEERNFRSSVEPAVDNVKGASFKPEAGALVLRTMIAPDAPVQISVRTFVKYDGETEHTLAFRNGPTDMSGLLVFVDRPERVGVRASLRRPSDQTVQKTPDGERLVFIPTDPPKAGEAVLLDLSGSPERHGLVRPLAATLAGALAVLVTLTFFARRRRGAPTA